ncbi:inositol monophosphatase family protein [Streptomyces tirandamycinicus]|uniref:inositol-phosphate phosphatase n=1 Tax=Streptomyces tirandamycinicus TaxID=2174846 RepID=A0A2S1SVX4_9ACTN|nr:inositol monophosphatase family protein [Streptomyces tirandamycinicus]AWI30427.1 inositol monophosphatase [Streptomyces tirandamycinicus]
MTDLRSLLGVAGAALDQASTLVTDMAVGAVQAKGDRDMVSEIDFAVEEHVRTFLQKETPEIGFLGEESGGAGAGGALTWALDPVDGTANLVNGIPLCGVSLGLIADNRSVLGVIDLPFLGQRYRAAEGHGAYCGDDRIWPRETTSLNEAIVAIGDYAVGERAQERNARRLDLTARLAESVLRVRMFGSAAVDLVWVASGKIDCSIALSNHPWDMAAGAAIAREAGAVLMDVDGTPHDLTSAATIAVSSALGDALLELLTGI